jgi:hypothetical protein
MEGSRTCTYPKDLYDDSIMIGKIALAIGYSGNDAMLLSYIHRKANESGKGIGYFRNGPRNDQAYDILKLGESLGMGIENDLHLVVGCVNGASPRVRDEVEADEIIRLYVEARDRGVTLADFYLSKLMLFFETGSSVRNVLCAYESEVLPVLTHIKSQNAMAEKENTKI